MNADHTMCLAHHPSGRHLCTLPWGHDGDHDEQQPHVVALGDARTIRWSRGETQGSFSPEVSIVALQSIAATLPMLAQQIEAERHGRQRDGSDDARIAALRRLMSRALRAQNTMLAVVVGAVDGGAPMTCPDDEDT